MKLVLVLLVGGFITNLVSQTRDADITTVEYKSEFLFGSKKSTCTFTVVLTGKELNIKKVNIQCSYKPKKKTIVEDFVHTIGTRIRIILSFSIYKSKIKVKSSAVENALENIENKLDAVFDIVEDIQEAVQDCSGNGKEEEQVIMIAGGHSFNDSLVPSSSVELYNPKNGFSCFIKDLPSYRLAPVASGLKVCGGSHITKDCVEFNEGSWNTSNQLKDYRIHSSGWDSSEGLVLMGGEDQYNTSEILRNDYSEYFFNLTSPRTWACSIPDDDTVVLTGGMYPLDEGYGYGVALVERYGPYGYVDALPFLNYARFGHGCGYYYKDGEKVLLVAGGMGHEYLTMNEYKILTSTEILIPGNNNWTYAQPLPEPLYFPSYTSLYNNIYLFGKLSWPQGEHANVESYYAGDSVYVWNGDAEDWGLGKGSLLESKAMAGVSVVPAETLDYCLEPSSRHSTNKPHGKLEDLPGPLKLMHEIMTGRK